MEYNVEALKEYEKVLDVSPKNQDIYETIAATQEKLLLKAWYIFLE